MKMMMMAAGQDHDFYLVGPRDYAEELVGGAAYPPPVRAERSSKGSSGARTGASEVEVVDAAAFLAYLADRLRAL